ncbi:MAG: methylated-DNA--[protein]-cysteine S-methyltransferase [Halieaceae bacterium]|nr:methylated-DNA--[protein]-cysteine S-methyltransferase [Halieaceae bacterium]
MLDYLNGKLTIFSVPILLAGTSFQLAVWERLTQIPYGAKLSYSAVARSIGHRSAARAVGLANGRNKLPIIVPCHRVICSDGKNGGYSAGAEIKDYLMKLENRKLKLGI